MSSFSISSMKSRLPDVRVALACFDLLAAIRDAHREGVDGQSVDTCITVLAQYFESYYAVPDGQNLATLCNELRSGAEVLRSFAIEKAEAES